MGTVAQANRIRKPEDEEKQLQGYIKIFVLTVYFLKMGECREVLGGGAAPPSNLETLRVQPGLQT